MSQMWVRAVWSEDGTEEEGTVPSNWIRNGCVLWPNTSNALKYMLAGKVPTSTWRNFPLVKEKFRSESRDECEAHNLTTSAETEEEEEEYSRRQRTRKRARVSKDFYLGDETSEREEPSPKNRPGSSRDAQSTCLLVNIPAAPPKHQKELFPPSSSCQSSIAFPVSPRRSPRHSPRMSPTGWSARISPRRSPRNTTVSPRRQYFSSGGSFQSGYSRPENTSSEVARAVPQRRENTSSEDSRVVPQRRENTSSEDARAVPQRRENTSSEDARAVPQRRENTSSVDARAEPQRRVLSMDETAGNQTALRKDAFPMPEEKFQRKVISLLAELRMEMRDLKQKVESGSQELADEGGIPLKARTIEELETLEKSLVAPEDQNRLTRALIRIGGSSAGENARKIMTRLMTYDTMAVFSLKGRKGKRPFLKLKLHRVIVDAIVSTVKCTEAEAEVAISDTLKYAPDRRGGGGRNN